MRGEPRLARQRGYRRFHHARLIKQIGEGIREAVRIDAVPYGERFRVEIRLTGPAGSAIVRSLWIIRTGEDVPRLISAYPIK